MMATYGVILFFTTSTAMRAEKLLLAHGIPIKLIPTPREISSNCGVALRFPWEQQTPVQEALKAAGVEIAGIQALIAVAI